MPVNASALAMPMHLQAVPETPQPAPKISQLSKNSHEEINLQAVFFDFSLLAEE